MLNFICNFFYLYFQAHNAHQLARWCLYVISTNYTEFETCDDFDLIKGDNLRHVLEHRWPPLAYLKELEEFKRKTGRAWRVASMSSDMNPKYDNWKTINPFAVKPLTLVAHEVAKDNYDQ